MEVNNVRRVALASRSEVSPSPRLCGERVGVRGKNFTTLTPHPSPREGKGDAGKEKGTEMLRPFSFRCAGIGLAPAGPIYRFFAGLARPLV
jgi:hypothetical protein